MAMRRFGLLFLLTFAGSAQGGGQLPPEILMDQLLLRAERLIEAEDSDGALEVIREILALQEEHGLELPPGFHFRHAQAGFAAGSLETAKESATQYLTVAGRDGEFYADALGLLEDVDGILERRGAPECAGQSEGSECWMEVADQPGCHVWSQVLQPGASATWTGRCAAGLVEGDGALTWTWPPDGSQTVEGTFRFGRPHGHSPSSRMETGQSRKGSMWTAGSTALGLPTSRTVAAQKGPSWTVAGTATGSNDW